MIAVVSPSKTMKEEKVEIETTKPKFIRDTNLLAKDMKKYDVAGLEELMDISTDLATLNHNRFQEFEKAKKFPAVYLFRGDVFKGIDIDSLKDSEIQYLNKHLRILSGLYGALKPLDEIKPYRLEMGTKHENERGRDLYAFWGNKVKNYLEKEAEDNILINLASNEYSKVILPKEIRMDVYDIEFREKKKDKYPIVAYYAKVARGEMARYMAVNNVQKVEELKGFNYSGYAFNEELSEGNTLVFTREQVSCSGENHLAHDWKTQCLYP
ncbi:peroxide stress protein YaaA [Proteiniclasticum sp. C24MP]|uniref:peroxide stress protein YaaA n=1 Tax=Proteiniclasticum sp. C24MP TaxID=3374101 RepID=UPI003754215B